MHGGQVKCCGSTMFLKKLYHVGYQLRMELTKEVKEIDLLNLIREYIPDAIYENRRANEHFIRLALDEKHDADSNLNLMIANLFDCFEKEETKRKFGIQTYGLTNTSLEDVFIKIGTLDQPEENAVQIENAEDHPLHNLDRIKGCNLFSQQFYAIFNKKFRLMIKNLQMFFSSIYLLLPPAIIILSYVLVINGSLSAISSKNTIESFNLKKEFGNDIKVLLPTNSFNRETDLFREENRNWLTKEFGFGFLQSNTSNIKDAVRLETARIGYDNLKTDLLFIPERISETSYKFHINPDKFPFALFGTFECFYRTLARDVNHDSDFNVNLKFKLMTPEERMGLKEDTYTEQMTKFALLEFGLNLIAISALSIMFSYSFVVFIELLHDELNSGSLDMQIIAGLSKTLYWIANLLYDYIFTVFLIAIACISLCLFDTNYYILSPYIGSIFLIFVLASLNCLLVTYFIISLNLKKEVADMIVKYSIFIAGFTIGIYDQIDQIISSFSNQVASRFPDRNFNVTYEKHSPPYAFVFKILSPVYNTFDPIAEYTDRFVTSQCRKISQRDECGLLNLRDFDLKWNIIAYLISIAIFSFLIVFVNYNILLVKRCVECLKLKLFSKSRTPTTETTQMPKSEIDVDYLTNIEDPNVEKERELTQMLIETNNLQSNILVVYDLYKLFGSLQAVDHLSFTVKREECFGLLGINGAGKTTTFKMIGGSIVPTFGLIVLDGFKFNQNSYQYYRRLGYCPQENTHTKHISVADNLRFFARINGIPKHLIERTVQTLIDECDLQDHKHKFTEKLSGGNKRKLSTAIALIGKKDLILLGKCFDV